MLSRFFFFNDTATTEIYTLSLHDALPIFLEEDGALLKQVEQAADARYRSGMRSEEHTSELQSRLHLVCRLLLEKKKSGSKSPAPSYVRLAFFDGPRSADLSRHQGIFCAST